MKNKTAVTALFIFIASLAYRISGIFANHPLWVDEFSTAHQASLLSEYGIGVFFDTTIFFEVYKITSTLLGNLGLSLFGHQEWALRIFFVLIGSLVPVLVFALSKRFTSGVTAISAAIFSTTSYFLITWSRQARSYSLQLVLALSLFYVFFKLQEFPLAKRSKNRKLLALYFFLVVLSIFTHPMLYIVLCTHAVIIAAEITHEVFNKTRGSVQNILKKNIPVLFALSVIIGAGLWIGVSHIATLRPLSLSNNVWLYHSFLWREYGLVSVLGGIGLLLLAVRKPRFGIPIVLFCTMHLIFITFIFPPPTTRYTLALFPWLFIGMALSLTELAKTISDGMVTLCKTLKTPRHLQFLKNNIESLYSTAGITLFLTLAIIMQGYKFDIKPNSFYSVNHDFREIALIDYDQLYDIIAQKGDLSAQQTAVIDTWADRAAWYLGNTYPAMYNFRWADAGLMKKTGYEYNNDAEKVLTKRPNVGFINEASDLKKVVKKYPKGFMLIDDTSMPEDVIMYAKTHFKEELTLRRYELDDNPLSDWPITLYSWGVE